MLDLISKVKAMTDLKVEQFDCFKVYSQLDNFSFFHIEIQDNENFYKQLFNYFFNEEKLLQYAENNFHLKFQKSTINYTKLYKNLRYFIDKKHLIENVESPIFDETLTKIMNNEYEIENKEGKNFIKIDKFGKVGEYILSCILSDYFKFDCIIPKIKLTTNYNMSVFGIDTLFYNSHKNMLLFGESKISKTIENGIELIKTSLKEYENQIKNEFLLTLSNRTLNCNKDFLLKFQNYIDRCIDFEEFVECAQIKTIGIPIFIAHGFEDNSINPIEIIQKLRKIPQKDFCNLTTKYYSISLPIINKDKLMAIFTTEMQSKEEFYKNAR